MLVLALDTAMSACSVALCSNGSMLAVRSQAMERGHAEALMPMIENVMAEGRRAYADLDLVAATVGPGAFTGIRIGLAAARGIALAAGKPCVGVTTLEALAVCALGARKPAGAPEPGNCAVLVAVESRRADLFVQAFDASGLNIGEAESLPPEGLPEFVRAVSLAPGFVLAGDGARRARKALAQAGIAAEACEGTDAPDPARIAALAAERHGRGAARAPKPFYLRPPDVTLPRDA
jgi:tRNA threonylcarbamoyladenosine biosynthesis protein TsaB